MENEIAFLKTDDGLEFNLTSDKLFITGATGTEAFALRSINGIGVIDLVDKYNSELNENKQQQSKSKSIAIFLFIMAGLSAIAAVKETPGIFILTIILSFFGYREFKNSKGLLPELKSCVRIMLNGMNRDFEFNKRKVNRTDVANFVARVEDTLTAFHKNQ